MALRAGYYGVKRFLRDKLETIAGTYDETIKNLFPRSEQAMLGAYSILPKTPGTKTIQGVTFTEGDNDVITLSGTASGYVSYQYSVRTNKEFKIPKGRWKVIPRKVGIDESYIIIGSGNTGDGSTGTFEIWASTQSEPVILTIDDVKSNRYVTFSISVDDGDITGSTYQPMIVPADTPDDFPYVSRAMTNRELTDSVSDQKTAINAIITAATGAADFAAFKTAMGAITPVTRSLSLTKEDKTEEVKEDIEPEKTVTKKRTTKKTEEV